MPVKPEKAQDTEVVTIAWDNMPENARRNLLEFLCRFEAAETVSVSLSSTLTELNRQRLEALTQQYQKK
jgi:hypothetical protein